MKIESDKSKLDIPNPSLNNHHQARHSTHPLVNQYLELPEYTGEEKEEREPLI